MKIIASRSGWALRVFSALIACRSVEPCPETHGICLEAEAMAFRLGFVPDALAHNDLDGDGAADIVLASSAAGTLTVAWEGRLTGVSTSWSLGEPLQGIVLADLDGDSLLDMATTLPQSNEVAILRGMAGRGFAAPERVSTISNPQAVVLVDVDGNSPMELAIGNVEGSVALLWHLLSRPPMSVGTGTAALASGDFDGDGNSDLAIARLDADAVQLMLGDGGGGFRPAALYVVGAAPSDVALADVDSDGALDIVTANAFDDTISVLHGDGLGGVTGRSTYPTVTIPEHLAVGPADSEPRTLGILSTQTSTMQVLSVNGNPIMGTSTRWASAIALGGPYELIYASRTGGQVGVLRPGKGLQLVPAWQGPAVEGVWPIDLEGDGVHELVVLIDDSPERLEIWRGGPDNSIRLDLVVSAGEVRNVLVGDVSGDAEGDLLIWTTDSLELRLRQQGTDEFMLGGSLALSEPLTDLVVADVDGDDVQEILGLRTDATANSSRLLRWNSDAFGTLEAASELTIGIAAESLTVIQGDGDEAVDLALVGTDGNVYYLEDSVPPARFMMGAGNARAFGDLDADGRADVALCDDAGISCIYDVLGPSSKEVVAHDKCDAIAMADIDADGSLDLLAQTMEASANQLVVYGGRRLLSPWFRSEDKWATAGRASLLQPIRSAHVFASLDGDPGVDVISVEQTQTQAYRSTFGDSLVEEATQGLTPLRINFGDINGDGALDLVGFGDAIGVALGKQGKGFSPLLRMGRDSLPPVVHGEMRDMVILGGDGDESEQILSVWDEKSAESVIVRLGLTDGTGVSVGEIARLSGKTLRLDSWQLNGDHLPDLVVFQEDNGLDFVGLQNAGAGQFVIASSGKISAPAKLKDIMLRDINGDGHSDAVGTGADSAGVIVCWGQSDTFGECVTWTPPMAVTHVTAGNFRQGEIAGIVVRDSQRRLYLTRGGASPSATMLVERVEAVSAADLDGDGLDELLVVIEPVFGTPPRSVLSIGKLSSDDIVDFADAYAGFPPATSISVEDVEGDGDLDIIVADDGGITVVRRKS